MNNLAIANIDAGSLPSLVRKAASQLASAETAAEVLEARDSASLAYDAAKRAARVLKAKAAHDEVIAAVRRSQADALEIEAMASKRLADEYDAAQERGEIAKAGNPNFSGMEKLPSGLDLVSPKALHEARAIRDAEVVEPGIVRRTLDEAIERGDEPTKARMREAVIDAAERALRGGGARNDRRNPYYQKPSAARAAWLHASGECRSFAEWATEENLRLALAGREEEDAAQRDRDDAAVRRGVAAFNKLAEGIDAK